MTSEKPTPLSADFVARRVELVPVELAHGYLTGHIDAHAVVRLAEHAVASRSSHDANVEELSLLLSDELERVPELIDSIESTAVSGDLDPTRIWLFLVLAYAYENRERLGDPMAEISEIYADFGYPAEIESFVPFLPSPEGEESGPAAIERRWRAFLDERQHEYAERSTASGS